MNAAAQAEDPDEILAAQIADGVLDLARVPGPHRLAAMQMTGLASDRPSYRTIGKAMGITEREVRDIESRALTALGRRFPELRNELSRQQNFTP